MYYVKIKPLSINKAWQGRRFKTENYKVYEKELYNLLPKINFPKKDIKLMFEFGFTKAQDIDSSVKQTLDIMQKKYLFNDKNIVELNVRKVIVKQGDEYIRFQFIL